VIFTTKSLKFTTKSLIFTTKSGKITTKPMTSHHESTKQNPITAFGHRQKPFLLATPAK